MAESGSYPGFLNEKFYRRRYNSTVLLTLAVLLFFLPFAQVKCGSVVLVENSGFGLATGGNWKLVIAGGASDYLKELQKEEAKNKDKEKGRLNTGPDYILLAALLVLVTGLLFSLGSGKTVYMATAITAAAGLLLLLAALIHMQVVTGKALHKSDPDNKYSRELAGLIRLSFTIWYIFTMVFAACAAMLGYMRYRLELKDEEEKIFDFESSPGTDLPADLPA